jgi:hypothetical protein
VRSEGVGALYRGLGWSLAGIFPEAALCYGWVDCRNGTTVAYVVGSTQLSELQLGPMNLVASRCLQPLPHIRDDDMHHAAPYADKVHMPG